MKRLSKKETSSGGEIRADYCVREEAKHKQRPSTQRRSEVKEENMKQTKKKKIEK